MTRVDAAGDALNATSQGLVSSSAVSAGIARQVAWQKPVRRSCTCTTGLAAQPAEAAPWHRDQELL